MTTRITPGRVLLLLLVLLAIAVPTLLQQGPGLRLAGSLRVLPQPSSFTELFIPEQATLQEAVQPSGATSFSVTAANQGTRTKHYTWRLTAGPAGHTRTIRTGKLTLKPHQSKTLAMAFTIADCQVRNQVSVALRGPDVRSPKVAFWVLSRSSSAWKQSGGAGCGSQ
jgi:hypothetical protein